MSSARQEPTMALPQPSAANQPQYSYVLYEDIESTYFSSSTLSEGTLCWVLKSKGINQRPELFLRARVVKHPLNDDDDDDDRVLVRYPKGSEYHVRRCNLIPVLEKGEYSNIVIVAPETPEYRRACVIHTNISESFLEIGCDFGPTVERVQKALTEVGAVPRLAGEPVDAVDVPDGRVLCLGVDKSPDSVEIAKSRYPDCTFSLEDALTTKGTAKLRSLCMEKLVGGYPSVVAIDINGNREIPAVLKCIENFMNPSDDVVVEKDWALPRLIVVKSRLLYAEMKKQQEEEENGGV